MEKQGDNPRRQTTVVSMYIDEALKARLERIARENERSLSSQIRFMLNRALEREAA